MNTAITTLRRARELRGMSLEDVADVTLINVKFLRALESGQFSILPAAYVRAFLRGYASAVGLDPAEVMKEFDEGMAPAAPVESPQNQPPPKAPTSAAPSAAHDTSRRNLLIAAGLILGILSLLVLWTLRKGDAPVPITERPFRDVVKEQEMRIAPPAAAAPVREVAADSLTLLAAVTDTCWVSISADSLPPHEYSFVPGNRAGWKARSFFTVTIGNAGGMVFTLNGTKLPPLGRRGAVVRNARISRQILQGK
jgi:cytoskeleton protein RodZ